jgi:aspartyl protease family protein
VELNSSEIARLVYLLLILLSVSGWLVVSLRRDLSKNIQRALIWALIFFGFFSAYGIWIDITTNKQDDFHSVRVGESTFEIKKASDGHFYTTATVNDRELRFLIDTGATKTILTIKDATRAGISISNLKFINPIRTANGMSYSATYHAKIFEWMGTQFYGVDLQIADENLFRSLMGMDIINQSKSFLISGDLLVLSF